MTNESKKAEQEMEQRKYLEETIAKMEQAQAEADAVATDQDFEITMVATNKVGISLLCTRPDELDAAAKEVRKFIRSVQKTLDNNVSFEMSVVVNPHGKDHEKPKKDIGFGNPIKEVE